MHKLKYETFPLIVITGPTATGKTRLAARLASCINAEIISADSRQVYKGLDLGTGKDYSDYLVDNKQVPYHLIDICDPGNIYNVFMFQRDFLQASEGILERGNMPLLCGGTGLYVQSAIQAYRLYEVPENQTLRPELESHSMDELAFMLSSMRSMHNKSDLDSKERVIRAIEIEKFYIDHPDFQIPYPKIDFLLVGLNIDRNSRRLKITARLKDRLENGMIAEVENLLNSGIAPETLFYLGLEYRYLTLYVTGAIDFDTMFAKLNTAIHQFAKRQMTWFRKMEREGYKFAWLDANAPAEENVNRVLSLVSKKWPERFSSSLP